MWVELQQLSLRSVAGVCGEAIHRTEHALLPALSSVLGPSVAGAECTCAQEPLPFSTWFRPSKLWNLIKIFY